MTKEGKYPTSLAIPENNILADLENFGYLGLKYILDTICISYTKLIIVQASNLKDKWEEIILKYKRW